MVRELEVLRRKGTNLLYLVCYIEDGKVRLIPYDVDSKNDGARRCLVKLENIFKNFERDWEE